MQVSYVYDQDPRHGWANIDMEKSNEGLIVVHDQNGKAHGFKFSDGEMTPTCICSARSDRECSCSNVDWSDGHKKEGE